MVLSALLVHESWRFGHLRRASGEGVGYERVFLMELLIVYAPIRSVKGTLGAGLTRNTYCKEVISNLFHSAEVSYLPAVPGIIIAALCNKQIENF